MADQINGIGPGTLTTAAGKLQSAELLTKEQFDRMTDGTVSLVDLRIASSVMQNLEKDDPHRAKAEQVTNEVLTKLRSQTRMTTSRETAADSGDRDSVLESIFVRGYAFGLRISDGLNRLSVDASGAHIQSTENAIDATNRHSSQGLWVGLCTAFSKVRDAEGR